MATTSYVPLSDPVYDMIAVKVRNSYPNACICWIEEVSNPSLQKQYDTYKTALIEKHGLDIVKELQLFHGTKEDNIQSIIFNGFDHSRNVVSAYGIGTYFAKNAEFSKTYAHARKNDDISFMIVANVVCAKGCVGRYNTIINKTLYDYAVDSLTAPTIYAIPNDEAALPKYIVAFYKNA